MEWKCARRLGIGLEIFEIHLFFGGVWERGRSLYGMKEILIGGPHQCDLICGGEGIEHVKLRRI